MLQRHEVFTGLERIEYLLLFLELFVGVAGGLDGQADAAFALVYLNDAGGHILTGLEHVLDLVHALLTDLRDMDEAAQFVVLQTDERAETRDLAADSGVLIQRVLPGGAAERAGLHGGNEQAYVGNTPIMLGGDLIVAIDGQEVEDTQDINAIMDKHQAGDTVSVTIVRGRRKMTIKLMLGEAGDTNT